LGGAAVVSWRLGGGIGSVQAIALRYALALIPLGFGLWLAHYSFHLLTGVLTIVPVVQSAAADLAGWPFLGAPLWRWVGLRPGAVFPIQIGFVLLGALGSFATAYALAERDAPSRPAAVAVPWTIVIALLAAAALWVLAQPMEMRAVELPG